MFVYLIDRTCNHGSTVGAVYARAYFVDSRNMSAVVHLAHSNQLPGIFPRSLPQLFGCDAGAFGHGFELRPHDGGMNAAVEFFLREAAIGSGNHVCPADALRKSSDTLRDQFRMFDNVCAV